MVEFKGELATVGGQTIRAIRIQDDEMVTEEALIQNQEEEDKLDEEITESDLQVQVNNQQCKI